MKAQARSLVKEKALTAEIIVSLEKNDGREKDTHRLHQDHPAALPNYLKAGFAIYKEEVKDQE